MSEDGVPWEARRAYCRAIGINPGRPLDWSAIDHPVTVITAPVVAAVLRRLSLAVDSPGDLVAYAREIERNSAALTAILNDQHMTVRLADLARSDRA